MEDYLNYTLNVLKSRNYVNLTIVLGNESCDLDSAVSSLVYATFLHWQHQKMKCKVCTRNKRDESTYKDDIFVSLLDVDRQDLPLKTEVAFCFKGHGLRENFLLFRDDIDLKNLVEEGKINIVLVDHHVLSKKYEFLSPYVTEIIDHRPIDRNNWSYKDDVRSTIEIVGSCCTLVTQRIQDLSALMNRGVILLDTVNFSKEVNKATPHDKDKVEFLENILKPSDCMEERKLKVQRLVEARSDVELLNAAQLLRKDVKILGDVLIPSFPILVEVYLRKPEALKAVSEALSQRNCTVALLLGMDLTGVLRRDGAIISDDAEKVELFSKILQEWSSPCLQLSPEENSDCFFFKQLNLSASRKQYIAPVNEFLNNCN
ncbi:exopolyphosphatase PRUNE1 isoform X2 [Pieris napi]|uniref:exopolyphosphatase PRUNE1 isoform X2 n=1 Tax=Pieris napi TaxID=78633 RepID=UPI001FBAEA29|nr:exopolyphosphatase PRUNE1 isoform X2 [Pieris napi]